MFTKTFMYDWSEIYNDLSEALKPITSPKDLTGLSYWRKLDEKYYIELELPGFKKDDITLSYGEGLITIVAKSAKKETKTIKATLPKGVKSVTAELDLGILTLSAPIPKPKEVSIGWK